MLDTIQNINDYAKWLSMATFDTDYTVRDRKNLIRGCSYSSWLSMEKVENSWSYSVDSTSTPIRQLFRRLAGEFSGMSDEELSSLSYSDFNQIAPYLNAKEKKAIQLLLNRVHVIISQQ